MPAGRRENPGSQTKEKDLKKIPKCAEIIPGNKHHGGRGCGGLADPTGRAGW